MNKAKKFAARQADYLSSSVSSGPRHVQGLWVANLMASASIWRQPDISTQIQWLRLPTLRVASAANCLFQKARSGSLPPS